MITSGCEICRELRQDDLRAAREQAEWKHQLHRLQKSNNSPDATLHQVLTEKLQAAELQRTQTRSALTLHLDAHKSQRRGTWV